MSDRSLGLALTALVALTFACKPGGSADDDAQPREADSNDKDPGQIVGAAGIEFTVPGDWIVLAEDEPNFALAYGVSNRPTHIPVCTIELRRQGPGPMPHGAHTPSEAADPGDLEYKRGALRGLIREVPGPEGSSVVVHCRAPGASKQWGRVGGIFASLRPTKTPVELPSRRANPKPEAIAELCTGTPARMTSVCARRVDGSVYCGATTGEVLTRVELPKPAVQISCAGSFGCARDAEGGVMCWNGNEAPTPVAGIKARDIAGATIVDQAGKLLHRQDSGFTKLVPLGDRAHALTEVERVLEGSNEAWGCVLREAALWCWDRDDGLPITLGNDGVPQIVAPAPGATDLRRMGDRLCVGTDGRWTCHEAIGDGAGPGFEFDSCEARACGCSPIGATRLSCEDEPYIRIDSRPLGRVSNVVAVTEPCAALADGTLVCRGPVVGSTRADPNPTPTIAGGLPGITHVLELRSPNPDQK